MDFHTTQYPTDMLVNLDKITVGTPPYVFHTDNYVETYVKRSELNMIIDDFTRRIYKVLKETNKIDIDENEFIMLLKEG